MEIEQIKQTSIFGVLNQVNDDLPVYNMEACRRLSFAVCFSRRIDDCSGFAGSYVVFNPFKYNP